MNSWKQVGFAFIAYCLFVIALMVFAAMLSQYAARASYLIVEEPGPDDISPAEISAVIEEARRIAREAGDA